MKLTRPTPEQLALLSLEEIQVLLMSLFDVVEQLEARIAEREGKPTQTSTNSSLPPSSDRHLKGAAEPREKGVRSSGGQPGHSGHYRRMSETPDTIIDLKPTGACSCGRDLEGLSGLLVERRQQIEIPAPRHEVVEYRQWEVRCGCGQRHRRAFEAGLPPYVSYGPRLKAYATGLVVGQFVALQRTCDLLEYQYAIRPSEGSLFHWVAQAAQRVEPEVAGYREAIRTAEVAHFDESGLRIEGKNHWLHVATTSNCTVYHAHAKRGKEGMEAGGILPHFKGVAVHDHWKSYLRYRTMQHALCNAHHLRELRYFVESAPKLGWAQRLITILVEAHRAVKAAKQEGASTLMPERVQSFTHDYQEAVRMGLLFFPLSKVPEWGQKRVKQSPESNLLRRLRDHEDKVLRFLHDFQVPFDNNLAERSVRAIKTKLKVSGGFRAMGGAEHFCTLRSVWETTRQRGGNPMERLYVVFQGG